jgi:hypothetical protein
VRVCNFYLTGQQVTAGIGLLTVSLALAVVAGVFALTAVDPRVPEGGYSAPSARLSRPIGPIPVDRR